MKVALDFDETSADSLTYFITCANKRFSTNYTLDDIDRWEYHEAFGIEKEVFWKYYHDVMDVARPKDILPHEGLLSIMPKIIQNNSVNILSARQHRYQTYLRDWVEHWFPGTFKNVLTCGGQESGYPKHELMTRAGLDLLVDDSYKSVIECRDNGLKAILFTAKHNEDIDDEFRADTWDDVYHLINYFNRS